MENLSQYLEQLVPDGLDFIITLALALLVFVVGVKVIGKVLRILKKSLLKKNMEPGVVSFLISAGKIALYVILVLNVAQILGFATSSLIAIVGSAGLAIGLALQGSLANFAGGVLILLMKPFVVGDYIMVDNVEGTVKKIDVVYTTLATSDNKAVVLPNGRLADSNIVNVTKEDKRRIDITVGIEYTENIKKVRCLLQNIADRQEARLTEMPVDIVVSALNESSVDMLVRLWVTPDAYWQTRWHMLEEIKNEFDANDIVIPFSHLDVTITK